MKTVFDIRRELAQCVPDKSGMREIIAAQFIADEDAIFGEVNQDWHDRELAWYLTQSRNVNDIKGKVPKIWQDVSDEDGNINSNYGWCIFSDENNSQFRRAMDALIANEYTRQAVMIYTRPTMHQESVHKGRYDFLCTNTVQLIIRDNVMHYVVNMRSSDAVFGYKGDRAWHDFVFDMAIERYFKASRPVVKGNIIWNAVSLHVYPRHEKLVQEWLNEHV